MLEFTVVGTETKQILEKLDGSIFFPGISSSLVGRRKEWKCVGFADGMNHRENTPSIVASL